jgi:hypothetical protein
MTRFLAIAGAAAALVCAPAAGAFPDQPGGQVDKRQTGCTAALENAILGTGGANASPVAAAQAGAAFTALCVP